MFIRCPVCQTKFYISTAEKGRKGDPKCPGCDSYIDKDLKNLKKLEVKINEL